MRQTDDSPKAAAGNTTAQVRTAFLRDRASRHHWPEAYRPELTHEDPVIQDLAQHLWDLAKPILEASDEGLSRLTFGGAIDQAASSLFAHTDIGIKTLTTAKQLLAKAFEDIVANAETITVDVSAETSDTGEPVSGTMGDEEEPAFVAKLDAKLPQLKEPAPGQAHLCLALGDVVLNVDLQVPSASWLYQGYQRLRTGITRTLRQGIRVPKPGRLGMMTDDRELTLGLRHIRQPEGEQPPQETVRETTVSLRRRK